ncbi:hypothetical protein GALMADRAFT_66355 [Galerina marginata CBS 339.88]|uniref:DUF4110 domain-containing protein n=1 Tax=Galerina marginata (strain CBS 339.88) TaxID=685588 RepID=A0A067TDD5_GALM3|nr:hypothetical protein GALMADRAFT_66355 [Galerina marginata CBS 339.88]
MAGDCPPYNDFAGWVHDPHNQRVYMFGGLRPGDESETPASDFYCYNTTTMKWENLTNALTFREPYKSPYSKTELKREKRHLPALSHPGCTLWRYEGHSFIFLFGGYDAASDGASSKVVIINLKLREWWYEDRLGRTNPRIAPSIVAIGNKVYIFGGYKELEGDPQACYSYSIAEHRPEDPISPWAWEVRDTPYSGHLPSDFVVGQAVAVYGGKKILLAPGRLNHTDERRLHFSKKTLFYFRIDLKAFHEILDPAGDPLPQDIGWYSIFELKQLPLTASAISTQADITKKRGRPPKNPTPPSQVPSPQLRASVSSSSSDSVVICAWQPRPGTKSEDKLFEPEIYHFSLTPDDRLDCLKIIQKVCDLNHNFEGFMVVGERMHLLGSYSDENSSQTDSDSDSDDESDATWNIHLDIPFNCRRE